MRGPGCLVCPWAAARPRAVRAASVARRVVSKPGQAPPPTSTAAWPSGPSGALHTSGAWCADVVRHFCLKLASPLLACVDVGMKPTSPLLARNGRFWHLFCLQWCRWFQGSLMLGVQWCCRFHHCRVTRARARESSPCSACLRLTREKVRPARSKRSKIGVFALAGRVFSRKRRWCASAGRTLSCKGPDVPRAGCMLSRPGRWGVLLHDRGVEVVSI